VNILRKVKPTVTVVEGKVEGEGSLVGGEKEYMGKEECCL